MRRRPTGGADAHDSLRKVVGYLAEVQRFDTELAHALELLDQRGLANNTLVVVTGDNGWSFPVALDRDGQLLNLYGIGDCPTTVFAKKGGVSAGSRRPAMSVARLRASVQALLAGRPLP